MHGKAPTLKAQVSLSTREPGDRPEVIIEFVRGGRSDGMLSFASVLPFLPVQIIYACNIRCLPSLPRRKHVINTCFARQRSNTSRSEVLKDRILPAMLAWRAWLWCCDAAGFAETAQIHNAAHDGRHSASFPCH
jgi:cobalt transporter subunit CbtB